MHRHHHGAAIMVALFTLTASSVLAQEPLGTAVDSLNARVRALAARLDSLEAGICLAVPPEVAPRIPTGDPAVDSLAASVTRLEGRLGRLTAAQCATLAAGRATPDTVVDELAAIRRAAAAAAEEGAARDSTPQPTGRRSQNVLNPEISVTGNLLLIARDESPQRDNAELREVEVAFQSALDPYSTAKIFLTFSEEEIGVEEGYLYWTGLPGRIRLDAGKFRQQLGDLNRWHVHALPETEYPLVYQRFLGEEGLGGVGLSLYTALPLSLAGGTHEVWIQGTTAESDPLYEGGSQPSLLGRLQNFWQLNRSTYMQIGVTGVGGNNSDADLKSRLAGLDFRLTYRPPEAATRRNVTFRTEGYRLNATEAGQTTNRYGAFVSLQVRTSRRWIFGARYDWVEAPRGTNDREWRITPTITWWQSEFVYLRLEGEHRNSDLEGTSNELRLQAVLAMGPHKHETY
jgi:hypothetical protein